MTNPNLPPDKQRADEVLNPEEDHCLNGLSCNYTLCACSCEDCEQYHSKYDNEEL